MPTQLIDLNNPITSDQEAMDEIKKRANAAWAKVRKVASKLNSDPTDDDDIDDFDVLAVAENEAQCFELLAAFADKIRTATPEQVAAMHKMVQGEFNLSLSTPKPTQQPAKQAKRERQTHNHDHDHGHDHSNEGKTKREKESTEARAKRISEETKKTGKDKPKRKRLTDFVSVD